MMTMVLRWIIHCQAMEIVRKQPEQEGEFTTDDLVRTQNKTFGLNIGTSDNFELDAFC